MIAILITAFLVWLLARSCVKQARRNLRSEAAKFVSAENIHAELGALRFWVFVAFVSFLVWVFVLMYLVWKHFGP